MKQLFRSLNLRKFVLGTSVAVIALLAIVFNHSLMPSSQVNMKIQSTVVNLRFVAPRNHPFETSQRVTRVRVMAFDSLLTHPNLNDLPPMTDRTTVELSSQSISVEPLVFDSHCTVTFELIDSNSVRQMISGGPVSATLLVSSRSELQISEESTRTTIVHMPHAGPPVTEFVFEYLNSSAVPMIFEYETDNVPQLKMHDLMIDELSFTKEFPLSPIQSDFISTVTSGYVIFPDLDKRIELISNSFIESENLSGTIHELKIANGLIEISFEGRINRLRIGNAGSVNEVSPTMLEYGYNQYRKLWVSGVLGLVGACIISLIKRIGS